MVNEVFFAFVFLPLLTRPAAPRLATCDINLPIETNRPHVAVSCCGLVNRCISIITYYCEKVFPARNLRLRFVYSF